MANSPVVSVVVPVYNAALHIKKCVESILNQTFRDFELILVDDGSEDDSGKVCDSLECKDQRIRVIHQHNAGEAGARNAGIKHAIGKYLAFCDSDDWLEDTFIEFMVKSAECNVMPICKLVKVNDDNEQADPDLENENIWCWPIINNHHISCWRCLYVMDIIRKNQLFFTIGRKTGADQEFAFKYMLHVEQVAYTPTAVYYYNINPNSIMFRKNYNHFHAVDAMIAVTDYAKEMCSPEKARLIANALEGKKYPYILEFAITTMLTAGESRRVLMQYLKDRGYYTLLEKAVQSPNHHKSTFLKLWKISPKICLLYFSERKRIGRFYRELRER